MLAHASARLLDQNLIPREDPPCALTTEVVVSASLSPITSVLRSRDRVHPLPLHARQYILDFGPPALQHDPLAVLAHARTLITLDLGVSSP